MLRVAVVIPVYNDAEFLRSCLRALADQSVAPTEVIVVDNASTDDSAEVARSFGARVIFEGRRGILSATAAGCDAARADIIARLDADSLPPQDWIEQVVGTFVARPGISAVTGLGDYYEASRFTTQVVGPLYLGFYRTAMGALLGQPPLYGSNMAMRSSVWRRVSPQVHRSIRAVHDDLDISYHFLPTEFIVYDPTLRVGLSARPIQSWWAFARRAWWAVVTIGINEIERLFRS